MADTLGEQMLAYAVDAVNAMCSWAEDEQLPDFDAREERVLETGRALLATCLGQLVSAAGWWRSGSRVTRGGGHRRWS